MCEYRYKGYQQVQGVTTCTGGMHKYRGLCRSRGVVRKHTEKSACVHKQRGVCTDTEVCSQALIGVYPSLHKCIHMSVHKHRRGAQAQTGEHVQV